MNIFDRYIGRQVLTSAFFAVMVLTIILVLGKVFKDLLEALVDRPDLDAAFIFRFLILVLPISLSISVPWAFLTSILLIFGRLSADSELISMRMAGMGMTRICLSVGVIAIAFTGLCGWMNIVLGPAAKAEMEDIKNTFINMAKEDPLLIFKDGKMMSEIPRHLIFATKKDGKLDRFQMIKMNEYFRPETIVISSDVTVDFQPDGESPSMVFGLNKAYLGLRDKADQTEFARFNHPYFREGPMEVPLDRMVKSQERLKPEILPFMELFSVVKQPGLTAPDRASVRTEISRRISFSFACVTLGLIGIPLGITAQRRETSVGFALSLIVGIVYFLLMTIFEMMRNNPDAMPHLLVWLPNIIFMVIGIIQFRKLARK